MGRLSQAVLSDCLSQRIVEIRSELKLITKLRGKQITNGIINNHINFYYITKNGLILASPNNTIKPTKKKAIGATKTNEDKITSFFYN